MKINHKKIGKLEILVSFQRTENGNDLPKHVALAKGTTRPSYEPKTDKIWYKTSYSPVGNIVSTYYLLWADNNDFATSGSTYLQTSSGRKMSFKSALKIFNELIKATEFVSFKKLIK
jgi:hypothetical protein